MPWNPEIYNQFKTIRYQPFYDLMDLISPNKNMKSIDLGCGTGEQTAILTEKFPDANFLGIDSSKEMLEKSKKLENERLKFSLTSTEEILEKDENWDLIFSNAALQWSDNHQELFPKIIQKLSVNGQLAIQMPDQNENELNKILFDLANEEPFVNQLKNWNRKSSVLSLDDYTQILFENGLSDLKIMKKVYPIYAKDHETLFNFISGSALIPYLEKLNAQEQEDFTKEFKQRIKQKFVKLPAVYSFKRLLIYGKNNR